MNHTQRHASESLRVDATFVFATRNRASQLRSTLEAYRRLDDVGVSWQLLIVDNASNDDTPDILDATRDLPLHWMTVTEPGQNNARNAALEHIRGELVIFTDDDAIPAPDCLKAYLAAAHRWPDEGIFGARIEPRFPPATPDWMRKADFRFASTAFARYAPRADEGRVSRHPYGPSFAVRRTTLGTQRFPSHLGPTSGSYAMGGEGHLLRRLKRKGWNYVHVPSARVEHVIRTDQVAPAWLIQRANKKGRGKVYLPSSRPERRLVWRGVPVKLWLAAIRTGLRFYLLRPFVSARVRTLHGIKYELRRGEIQQRLARPTKADETGRSRRADADTADRYRETS